MSAMLTVDDVAIRLTVSIALVYSWVETGLLACYRLGKKGKRGAVRIAEEDLAAFLESRKFKAEQPIVKSAVAKPIKLPKLQNITLKPS